MRLQGSAGCEKQMLCGLHNALSSSGVRQALAGIRAGTDTGKAAARDMSSVCRPRGACAACPAGKGLGGSAVVDFFARQHSHTLVQCKGKRGRSIMRMMRSCDVRDAADTRVHKLHWLEHGQEEETNSNQKSEGLLGRRLAELANW